MDEQTSRLQAEIDELRKIIAKEEPELVSSGRLGPVSTAELRLKRKLEELRRLTGEPNK